MDTIFLKGLRVFAYHGVNPEEKRNGQIFVLDLELETDLTRPCATDRVEDTVNYAQVRKAAAAALTARSYDLIEAAAQAVADELLAAFPAVQRLTVTLCKPDAPMQADFDTVGVKLTRGRQI